MQSLLRQGFEHLAERDRAAEERDRTAEARERFMVKLTLASVGFGAVGTVATVVAVIFA